MFEPATFTERASGLSFLPLQMVHGVWRMNCLRKSLFDSELAPASALSRFGITPSNEFVYSHDDVLVFERYLKSMSCFVPYSMTFRCSGFILSIGVSRSKPKCFPTERR